MRFQRRRWPPPRRVAITGAASGIGQALAWRLAGPEARLALADRDHAGLVQTAERCRSLGAYVHSDVLDVADARQVQQFADDAAAQLGGVQAVCNVAGIINAGDIELSSLEDIALIMNVNFGGVVHGTKAFLPHLLAAGGGAVVNVSSAFGLISGPSYGAYNASKFAVRAWSDALRMEMAVSGRPVRVVTVYPGGTRTPIMRHSTSAAGDLDAAARRHQFDTRIARTEPGAVADHIASALVTGRRRVLVGADAHVADLLARVSATGYERLMIRVTRRPTPE